MTRKKTQQPPEQPNGEPKQQASIDRKAVDVKISVQPVDFYKENAAWSALEVGVTDSYVLVYQEHDEAKWHEYRVYDASGKSICTLHPSFVITGKDIAEKTSKSHIKASNVQSSSFDTVCITDIAKHFPSYLQTEIVGRFDKALKSDANFGEKYNLLNHDKYKQSTMAILRGSIGTSSDGNKIVLTFWDSLYWIPTIDSDGIVIEYNKLRLNSLPKDPEATLLINPWLKEHVGSGGQHIPDTDLNVRLENLQLIMSHEHKATKIFTDAACDYALDPLDGSAVYYAVPNSHEIRILRAKNITETHITVDPIQLPIQGSIKELNFDPNGNFFLVTCEEEGREKLVVLERDTLERVSELPDVREKVRLDSVGNLYFIDTNGKLRLANSNFLTFERGGLQKQREVKRKKLTDLQKRLAQGGIKLPDDVAVQAVDPARLEEEHVVRSLSRQLDLLFAPHIGRASSLADIDKLHDKMDALRLSDDFKDYPAVFAPVEEALKQKGIDFKVSDLTAQLELCTGKLADLASIHDMIDSENLLASIRRSRRDIVGLDPERRSAIDTTIRDLEVRMAEKRSTYHEQLEQVAEQNLATIKSLIATTSSIDELNHIIATDQTVAEFEDLLGYLEPQQNAVWHQRYRDLILAQNTAIKRQIEEEAEVENFRIARTLEETDSILVVISQTIDESCDTPKAFDRWLAQTNNPIVTRYRAKLLTVPDNLRNEREAKLDEMLKAKRRDLEHAAVMHVSREGDEIDFGTATFPVFRNVQVVWQPKIRTLSEGSDHGHLTFEDNFGHVFRAPSGAIPTDFSDDVTRETIDAYKTDAARYFESLKREVPGFNEKWVMSDYIKGYLSKMAKLLKKQSEHQRGILILEGEAGTGKNVLVDMFCHFTNRETHTFSCNFQTEKEDITYAFKYDVNKGTYNVDSRLIEMLQTPGAVIVLDEINTLPPGVAKMLNPLLDYRRCLYLPDGRVIKAHPTVLILGTMNPQHYIGVKPLSQEVKSRARVLFVDYPPATCGGVHAYDEALILSRYVDSLRDLSDAEFLIVWNYTVNNDTGNGGDKYVTPENSQDCGKLLIIIRTAQKIREAYRAYRTGESAEPIEFVFSMRETIDITTELSDNDNVKEAIKDVILPKVSDHLERKALSTIIDNV